MTGEPDGMHVAVDANVMLGTWGGIPRYVDRLTRLLASGPDRLDLLFNARRPPVVVPGARTVAWRLKGPRLWRELAVPASSLRHRPDVLWAPHTELPRWPTTPTVATVHDLAPLLFPGSKPPAVERAYHTTVPRSVRAATRVICVSRVTAQDVIRAWGVAPQRIHVIPNGVDERFRPGDHETARAHVRRRYGLDGPYVLHVGSFEPRKGLDVLLAASEGAPWQLVLAGAPGAQGAGILARAQQIGATVLTDVDDHDLVSLYRAAETLAAPALYEGFGLTPLEAMACATPALVAGGAGALEEVSGPGAVVVAQRTPAAWRAGVEEVRDRRADLAAAGVAHAARYRWPHVAAATRVALLDATSA